MRTEPADDVLEQLNTLIHGLKKRLRHTLEADEAQLAPMEARALAFFARHPAATQADLAAHSGRDKAQITRLIKALIARDLLRREADGIDRRSHRLGLTDSGRALHKRVQQHRRRLAATLVEDFSPKERELLNALLRRMCSNIGAAGPNE